MRGIDGSRNITFRYELLDNEDKKIRDMDEVISGSVAQNNLGVIKRRATFSMSSTDDIDFINHRIKPYVRLDMSQIRFPPQPREPKFAALQDTFTELPPSDSWVNYEGGATNTLDGLELPAVSDPPDAPTLVAVESEGGFQSDVVVDVPPGTLDGHRMLVAVSANDEDDLTPPAGWNEIIHETVGTNTSFWIFERVANDEPSSYEWSFSGSHNHFVIHSTWSGVQSIRDYGVNSGTNTDSVSAPSLSAVFKDTLVLVGFHWGTGSAPDWDDPESDLTEVDRSGNLLLKSYNDEIITGSTPAYALEADTTGRMAAASLLLVPEGDPPQESGYSLIETDEAWGLLGTFVRTQLTGVLDPTGASEAYTRMVIEGPGTGNSLSINHDAISGDIEFEALSNSSSVASGSEVYSSTDHQFLRILEEDRTTYFQTSPSGWDRSWTTQVSLDTPQWVIDNNSSLKLFFQASRDGGDADAAYWTNLNSGDTRSLLEPNKKYVEWPLGIFLMSSPAHEADAVGDVTREVESFDKTQVYIDDRTTERLSTASIKYINDDFDRVEDLEGSWGDFETGESWNFIPREVT